jgi:hypothetical protein
MFSLSTLITEVAEEDNNIYLYLCKENLRWNPVCLEKLMYEGQLINNAHSEIVC